ncbi:hypothetical protein COV04_02540 [Candidatus Uhrbacteria bacterium CG10_big_fil_rev_8_21_14_0_10_48_11]|uniref:Glycosyltransferase 2-like domain-containing protein n=1 Tax=Candidatus Uhrbacteria bacterium CG10_big_fil_rev_8_21_14_0_10_48_11 TaxID=1975037 RepID=A0A2M8LED3_9BACT|nr:MAG: hypothetical protein COV04_02540 [Candidatus Uhrbacteria bacterium CG10_big_fil_rev_8_21_14_0_10_48_11]
MNIGIVIVTWNSVATIAACLESIPNVLQDGSGVEVVVVDNGSKDGTVALLKTYQNRIKLSLHTTNLGFAKACNEGASVLQECEYLVFLNPDTVLQPQCLEGITRFFRAQPFVGVVGPKMLNVDNSIQASVRTFPSVFVLALNLLKVQHFFSSILPLRRYLLSSFNYSTLREVDQVMGACFAVRKTTFDSLNGFDERFFIWFEEVDFCKRAKEIGSLIFFVPWATARHVGGHSFGQRSPLWRQWFFSKSARQYARKHFRSIGKIIVAAASYLALLPALLLTFIPKAFRP